MEGTELYELVKLLGVDVVFLAAISIANYFFTELLKGKYPKFFNGWKTDLFAFVFPTFIAAYKIRPVDVYGVAQLLIIGLVCWALASGKHQLDKKKANLAGK